MSPAIKPLRHKRCRPRVPGATPGPAHRHRPARQPTQIIPHNFIIPQPRVRRLSLSSPVLSSLATLSFQMSAPVTTTRAYALHRPCRGARELAAMSNATQFRHFLSRPVSHASTVPAPDGFACKRPPARSRRSPAPSELPSAALTAPTSFAYRAISVCPLFSFLSTSTTRAHASPPGSRQPLDLTRAVRHSFRSPRSPP